MYVLVPHYHLCHILSRKLLYTKPLLFNSLNKFVVVCVSFFLSHIL